MLIVHYPYSPRLELSYMFGGIMQYKPGEKLQPRQLGDFELVWIMEGRVTYRVNGATEHLNPGDVVLARPGFNEQYQWDPKHATRHAYFHFQLQSLPEGWQQPEHWHSVYLNPPEVVGAIFRHIIDRIYSQSAGPLVSPGARECSLVEALISVLLFPVPSARPTPEHERGLPLRRAIQLLRRQVEESPSSKMHLADIATASGVSPKHLCRIFAKELGYSPMQTFNLLRMQVAAMLLTRSNLRIKEVALRCGFEDPLYFSRCFARVYGVSATQFRLDISQGKSHQCPALPVDITPRFN